MRTRRESEPQSRSVRLSGLHPRIAGAMIIVSAVLGAMGPRTTRLRLERFRAEMAKHVHCGRKR